MMVCRTNMMRQSQKKTKIWFGGNMLHSIPSREPTYPLPADTFEDDDFPIFHPVPMVWLS